MRSATKTKASPPATPRSGDPVERGRAAQHQHGAARDLKAPTRVRGRSECLSHRAAGGRQLGRTPRRISGLAPERRRRLRHEGHEGGRHGCRAGKPRSGPDPAQPRRGGGESNPGATSSESPEPPADGEAGGSGRRTAAAELGSAEASQGGRRSEGDEGKKREDPVVLFIRRSDKRQVRESRSSKWIVNKDVASMVGYSLMKGIFGFNE